MEHRRSFSSGWRMASEKKDDQYYNVQMMKLTISIINSKNSEASSHSCQVYRVTGITL